MTCKKRPAQGLPGSLALLSFHSDPRVTHGSKLKVAVGCNLTSFQESVKGEATERSWDVTKRWDPRGHVPTQTQLPSQLLITWAT